MCADANAAARCYYTRGFHGLKPDNLLDQTFNKPEKNPVTIVPRSQHNISRKSISRQALKVLYRLKDEGYQAFLVGGGVRDLLLGREPKDFDIVTDAHPEEVRAVFRNSRLIGRRFRLAHVHFGRDYIEVATFRAAHDDEPDDDADRVVADGGRILRDNLYGSIDQDVWRRDFTINALYYNIADYSVWDYTDGMQDVERGQLRMIGDAAARYREDPVRMLRAVRFSAKLGFKIEATTEAPLFELGALLHDVSPARLFEEALKLFLAGHAAQSFEFLNHYGLLEPMLPLTYAALTAEENASYRQLLGRGLENTDKRVANGQPVTPFFLFALFLWGPVRERAEAFEAAGESPIQALHLASHEVARDQQGYISVPRRFITPMREMFVMQARFGFTRGKRPLRLVEHPRFRAAYDFLLLRIEAGEAEAELGEWWTRFQTLAPEQRRKEVGVGNSSSAKAPHKKRRRRRGSAGKKAGGDA